MSLLLVFCPKYQSHLDRYIIENFANVAKEIEFLYSLYGGAALYIQLDTIQEFALGWSGRAADDFVMCDHGRRLKRETIVAIKEHLENRKERYVDTITRNNT